MTVLPPVTWPWQIAAALYIVLAIPLQPLFWRTTRRSRR
jgi:hypothetical protein